MSFLVINCGTSSVKMTVFQNRLETVVEVHLKQIFSSNPVLKIDKNSFSLKPLSSYRQAIEEMIVAIKNARVSLSALQSIGHRVVHGGEQFTTSVILTPEIKKKLSALSGLAPLHNPPALEGIGAAHSLFPHIPQIAVFDTAFHTTLPPKAAYYPLPWELSQKHQIKRYGFHGIAHAFSWQKYASSGNRGKIITAHLGSGCSLAAIDNGVSKDTTMGFTPLDGVMMATRSGELDPAIVAYLSEKEKISPNEVVTLLNHQSGLLGMSGKTQDMKQILDYASQDVQSNLALETFIYSILKKIGSFIVVLEGCDALIFSGGIGENSPEVRKRIAAGLTWYSASLDQEKNSSVTSLNPGQMQCISSSQSKVKIYVVGSDENIFIAEQMQNSSVNSE